MAWAVKQLQTLGHQEVRIRSDQAASIKAVTATIAANRIEWTVIEETPSQSHRALRSSGEISSSIAGGGPCIALAVGAAVAGDPAMCSIIGELDDAPCELASLSFCSERGNK